MTRLSINDLPAHVRRKLVPPIPSCSGEGASRSSPTAVKEPRRDIFHCHRCGQTTRSLAGAQRHADQTAHHRFDWVCP